MLIFIYLQKMLYLDLKYETIDSRYIINPDDIFVEININKFII